MYFDMTCGGIDVVDCFDSNVFKTSDQWLGGQQIQCSKSYVCVLCLEIRLCDIYKFETWSLTLREESRLRIFENGVLSRIFGPKRDEVKGRV
jgi:hypothetical protein